MTDYLIEFALIHIILFVAYKLLLDQETQLATKRVFILSSTILALTIPFIQLPNFTPIDSINITESISQIMLPAMIIENQQGSNSWLAGMTWYHWFFMAISLVLAIRLMIAIIRLIILYVKSEPAKLFGSKVRHIHNLETSFTFFSLIFIDKNAAKNVPEIIHHEAAHIKYGHSYDLLLFNMLTILFWWVPSIWLSIRELRFIHEYEADSYTLGLISYKSYLQTLVNHSLNQKGLILTNSFNDIPITKRLNYMKLLKKKISPWKATSLLLILAITGYTFSCQTQNIAEVERHVEAQMEDGIFLIVEDPATPVGGIGEFYKYITENLQYPDKALENGVSGKIFIEFVVQKDGSISNIKILKGIGFGCDEEVLRLLADSPPWIPGKQKGRVVKQRFVLPITFKHPDFKESDLPDQVKIQDAGGEDRVFLIVEESASFDGGMTEFYNYVSNNLHYTNKALNDKIEGKVFIEFIVNVDGTISDVKILRGIGSGLDEEAKRVVEGSPIWIPGKQKGHIIRQKMVLPITFRHPDFKESGFGPVKVKKVENDDYVEIREVPMSDKEVSKINWVDVEVAIDEMPSFPGGQEKLHEYIQKNLNYPKEALNNKIEGIVYVQFKVNTDGSISNVQIYMGIGAGCDEEAKRIIENSPKWTPMKVGNKEFAMYSVVPVTFRHPDNLNKPFPHKIIEVPVVPEH